MQANSFALDSSDFKGNQVAAGGALLDKIREVLSSLSISLPPKSDFLKMVDDAYETYVRPIDIPGIPNMVEPWVDSALKSIVLQQASRIYDNFAAN
ncbi:hypothetical protein VN12_04185 [Pirellula sp. SH-Sr6A]|uniref:hypothetical protein n=1 Tax=Pirellula sp. SH-Sr6A TaxID=1632865 RepID=UPI00078D1BB8|nr:hypothetical protein [Pirellula sp. SH-Sr6A]AMV31291.1 hypothetical protein VN12_04185 [Pirellula sp. SH-Sr6A]